MAAGELDLERPLDSAVVCMFGTEALLAVLCRLAEYVCVYQV